MINQSNDIVKLEIFLENDLAFLGSPISTDRKHCNFWGVRNKI